MTATYGMRNVSIRECIDYTWPTWLVYADTDRWGDHEIMAQFPTKERALDWCKENGVEDVRFELPSARERAEREVWKGSGKIQIGNVMYRYLKIENDRIIGHSNGYWGWRDITDMIDDCHMISEDIGRSRERVGKGYAGRTVKFGNACTW